MFAVGVRLETDDRLHVEAPLGLADLFGLRLRPNPHRPFGCFRLGFRMPAWREHSPRCRVQRAGVRKSPKNEPAGQRRAAGRLWGFGHAAVLAEDHFAPIGESWSRR
jgi:hypothetical protein